MEASGAEACLSDGSSISAALEGSLNKGKAKVELKFDGLLDLEPKELDHDSKVKPDLIDFLKVGSSQTSASERRVKKAERKFFYCNYCKRKFSTSQALGGHQNAHRHERSLAKREQGKDAADLRHPHTHLYSYPYSYHSVATIPSNGFFNRSLGIPGHSMIHKPYNSFSLAGHRYEHRGWSKPDMVDRQPGFSRLNMENHLVHNGGLGRVLGGSPAITVSNTAANRAVGDGYRWEGAPLGAQQSATHGLDLSLKL